MTFASRLLQLQPTAVHTPAGDPFAPPMLKSRKLPAATGTLPVMLQLPFGAAVHASAVFAMLLKPPFRNVTVTGFPCCENTESIAAVQAAATHVNTAALSLALAAGFVTE